MKNRRVKDVLNSYSINRIYWSDSVYSSDSVYTDHTFIPNEPTFVCAESACDTSFRIDHEKKNTYVNDNLVTV